MQSVRKRFHAVSLSLVYRKWVVFIGLLLFLGGYFLLPANREWLKVRIIPYLSAMPYQIRHQSIDERKKTRYGKPYEYAQQIRQLADRIPGSDSGEFRVLIPGAAYLQARGIAVAMPDPVTFYYFTGLRTVTPSNPQAVKSTWYLHVERNEMRLYPFQSDRQRMDTLLRYK